MTPPRDYKVISSGNINIYDSDFNKGYIQGLITVTLEKKPNKTTLPHRYTKALKEIAKTFIYARLTKVVEL